jgi:stearoyl-CoA desaturase (delta-9 desaturase)
LGEGLHFYAPGLETTGPQLLVWGIISTVLLLHGTCTINSLAHLIGKRRYQTKDHSRNSFILALITLGEGWHNNHHHYPASTRQGFFWWEIDITFYGLKMLSWLGLIWDLRPVPASALNRDRLDLPASVAENSTAKSAKSEELLSP